MKKILLGTSALAVAALTAGVASAEAPVVSYSGSVKYAYVFYDQDLEGSKSGRGHNVEGSSSGSELGWNAVGTTDGGLEYTARIELRPMSSGSDKIWIQLADSWGTFQIGKVLSPVGSVVDAHSLAGQGGGQDGSFSGNVNAVGTEFFMTASNGEGSANKVAYYTPDFSGFSIGASLQPGENSYDSNAADGTVQNVVEVAAFYSGEFSGASVNLGAGYVAADATDEAANENTRAYHLGATVGFGDFTVGGGYVNNGESGIAKANTKQDAGKGYNIGVSYSGLDSLSLAAIYTSGEVDDSAGTTDETDIVTLNADYTVADGLVVFGEYSNYDYNDGSVSGSTGENEANVFLLGTKISF